jgi:hypothetical protein
MQEDLKHPTTYFKNEDESSQITAQKFTFPLSFVTCITDLGSNYKHGLEC